MKRLVALILLSLMAFATLAQQFNPGIIPTPQKVEKRYGICNTMVPLLLTIKDGEPVAEKDIAKVLKKGGFVFVEQHVQQHDALCSPDSGEQERMAQEGYVLEIDLQHVTLYYLNDKGLENGRRTFRKLEERWEGDIPCMTIADWPDLLYRGWMDDYSRGPIANEHFRRQSEKFLLDYGYNYAQYYTEHIFYNPEFPDVAPSPLATMSDNHNSIMANLQCFAHFEKTLKIPYYIGMKDSPFNIDPSKQESYDFLAKQIENVVRHFPNSKFFNINCDETEALGSGRAKDYVSAIGAEEAYVQHINKVYNLIKSYNKEVLMWGDIVGKKPEMLEKLPKDMQYVVWSYVPSESFVDMIAPFKTLHDKYGTQFWIACGVSHWSHIIPSQHNYIRNIANFARDGHNAGALGYMNTAWDDSGESLLSDCWHALLWGGEMGWNTIKPRQGQSYEEALAERERQFNENYNWLMNRMANSQGFDYAGMLYEIGDLCEKEPADWMQVSALNEPLLDFFPTKVDTLTWDRCEKTLALCNDIARRYDIPTIGADTQPPISYIITTKAAASYALHRLQVTAQKNMLRILMYRAANGEKVDFFQEKASYFKNLHALKKEYLRLWDRECTEYSRNIICDRYDKLGFELLEADRHVFINTYSENGKMMVEFKTLGNYPIYYTLDGRNPSEGSRLYSEPFELERSCEIKAVCFNEYSDAVETDKYLLRHKGMGHLQKLNTEYSTYRDTYSAGGDNALLDGVMGSDLTYNDGHWQGYWGKDIDVEIDLGSKCDVNQILMRFLQNSIDWILAPKTIEIYTSVDGRSWTLARTETFNPDFRQSGNIVRDNAVRNLGLKTRYLRVVAKNPGKLPEYTPGAGYDSYLFCDEIVVE